MKDDQPITRKSTLWWAAFSSAGHVVPFIGFHYRKRDVEKSYKECGGTFVSLRRAGYRVARVRITPVVPRKAGSR